MTEHQMALISELRHLGYAVVVFYPEEVGTANPQKVEDRLVELGWDVISALEEEA